MANKPRVWNKVPNLPWKSKTLRSIASSKHLLSVMMTISLAQKFWGLFGEAFKAFAFQREKVCYTSNCKTDRKILIIRRWHWICALKENGVGVSEASLSLAQPVPKFSLSLGQVTSLPSKADKFGRGACKDIEEVVNLSSNVRQCALETRIDCA